MEYSRIGNTGLEVSRLCLRCVGYGEPDRGGHPWTLTGEKVAHLSAKRLDWESTSSFP